MPLLQTIKKAKRKTDSNTSLLQQGMISGDNVNSYNYLPQVYRNVTQRYPTFT